MKQRETTFCGETVIAQRDGFALVQHEDGRGAVVGVDYRANQITSAIPADHPASGKWFAGFKAKNGVGYVANWRAWRTARRWFRQLTTQ